MLKYVMFLILVPGSLYEVEEFYLEDVLKTTGYMTKKMKECKLQLEKCKSLLLLASHYLHW